MKTEIRVTPKDIDTNDKIKKLAGFAYESDAVCLAIRITRSILDALERTPKTQLILRHPDGTTERLFIPFIEKS